MKTIAIVAGGDSGEYEVSLNSADMVMESIDSQHYVAYKVVIRHQDWQAWVGDTRIAIDKNDFSFHYNGQKVTFDAAYIIVHGTPGEDGKIQGYFDLIEMPYTSPNVLVSALTMNKALSKTLCKAHKISVADHVLVTATEAVVPIDQIAEQLGIPCFIKPNNGGSSVATTKAYTKEQMIDGIEAAFEYDDEVIVEQFLKGTELTCGVFFDGKAVFPLPVTEIVPHNDFFDYEAKYLGKSDEITPARIDAATTQKVQKLAAEIYTLFNIRGLVRVDFILSEGRLYFMEVNTVPGFSKASIVPQQIRAAGLRERDVISLLIEQAIMQRKII